jgi:hypothetical protein
MPDVVTPLLSPRSMVVGCSSIGVRMRRGPDEVGVRRDLDLSGGWLVHFFRRLAASLLHYTSLLGVTHLSLSPSPILSRERARPCCAPGGEVISIP